MSLIPMNDAVFGEPVTRDKHSSLAEELTQLAGQFEASTGLLVADARTLTASLAPEKVPFQVVVTGVGPEVKEVKVGDLAILPKGGGTMVTITQEGVASRLYMIAERHILAVYREDHV